MTRAILLDCGGVLVRPSTGSWGIPRNFHALMDGYLRGVSPEALKRARARAGAILNAEHHMYTEDIECGQRLEYYRNCYVRDLGLPVPEDVLRALAVAHVYDDARFVFYDDVLPMLRKWRGTYLLGMVSDTHPSLRRVMRAHGSLALFDAVSLSCELGAMKPDPRMYERALIWLNVRPEEAVFVDDIDGNLFGARALGIQGVKMKRAVYTDGSIRSDECWDGPEITDLAGLDALLRNGL